MGILWAKLWSLFGKEGTLYCVGEIRCRGEHRFFNSEPRSEPYAGVVKLEGLIVQVCARLIILAVVSNCVPSLVCVWLSKKRKCLHANSPSVFLCSVLTVLL